MKLVPSRCRQHPLLEEPCPRCEVMANFWRKSEAEQERITAIINYTDTYPASIDLIEAEPVLVNLQVDTYSLREAVRRLNETVWRLTSYPDFTPKRILASQTRDFLQTLES